MSALPSEPKPRSPLEVILDWWRYWTRNSFVFSDLACCAEGEVERLARDVGVSVPELRRLARLGPHGANLLSRRMAALYLDQNEVSRVEPRILQDLQRVCAACENQKRCARDLKSNSTDSVWEDYCPNVATLKALDAMPWASRREW